MRAPAIAIVMFTLLGPRVAGAPWQELAPLPRGVAGHAAAFRDGAGWSAGGSYWTGGTKHIDAGLWQLNPGAASWRMRATIPGGFAHGGWVADEATLWLVGGLDEQGPAATIHRIDLGRGTIARFASLPEPRPYCGAALLDDALWVIGGTPADGDYSRASDICWRIDITSRAINRIAGGPAFVNPLVFALDGELHVLSGSVWSAARKTLEAPTAIWIFSPRTHRWRQTPLAQPLPRAMSGAAVDGRHVLLAGGVEPGEPATLSTRSFRYDAAKGTITPEIALPQPRLAAAMVAGQGKLLLIGGEDRPRGRTATVWCRIVGPDFEP